MPGRAIEEHPVAVGLQVVDVVPARPRRLPGEALELALQLAAIDRAAPAEAFGNRGRPEGQVGAGRRLPDLPEASLRGRRGCGQEGDEERDCDRQRPGCCCAGVHSRESVDRGKPPWRWLRCHNRSCR